MQVPTIDHPTDRVNFTMVVTDGVTYWFSYRTCVAFNRQDGNGTVVRVNEWGPTTGKHLNLIDNGRGVRVDGSEFADMLEDEESTL